MEPLLKYPLNQDAYEDWREWRKTEKKKPITKRAEKMQHMFLQKYPEDLQRALIDHSMRNDYQGLFPPQKGLESNTGRSRDSSFEKDLTSRDWAY